MDDGDKETVVVVRTDSVVGAAGRRTSSKGRAEKGRRSVREGT